MSVVMAIILSLFACDGAATLEEDTHGGVFLEMLELIPDTPGTRNSVYISNHAKIREIYDVSVPPSDADDMAIAEYINKLWGAPSAVAGDDPFVGRRLASASFISGIGPDFNHAFHSPIRRQNIGFGPQDVDMDIIAGVPPTVFEAAKGGYNPATIEDALNNYDEAESPEYEEYRGIAVYAWGYDGNELNLTRRLSPPFFDSLGRCRPLGVGDGHVLRAFVLAMWDHFTI